MEVKKFWNWQTHRIRDETEGEGHIERILELNGVIASDSWFDDDVTPQIFKDELNSGDGDITVWINSPGGDCFAAAEIYNALLNYPGRITVKIDGLAASAASVIAMAGDTVLVSPVSMVMIHNPSTIAFGDHNEMAHAIEMLDEVKESIINAYQRKTGLSRAKLSKLMDAETWLNANKAVELGFADDIMERSQPNEGNSEMVSVMYSQKAYDTVLLNKIEAHFSGGTLMERLLSKGVDDEDTDEPEDDPDEDSDEDDLDETTEDQVTTGRSVAEISSRLEVIKHFI